MENKTKPKFFKRKYAKLSMALFCAIALSIVFFFAIYYFKDVNLGVGKLLSALQPFIYGAIIAYLLVPMCNFLDRHLTKLLKRISQIDDEKAESIAGILSIFFSLLIAILLIYILLSLILPQTITSLTVVINNFPDYYDKITAWAENSFKDNKFILKYVEGLSDDLSETVTGWIKTELLPNTKTLISSFSSGVMSAVSILKNILIGVIVSIYFLRSRKTFAAQSKILVHCIMKEKHAKKLISEIRFANKMFMGFISGRLVDSAIIGVLCFIGLEIMSMPYALLISVLVGITNIIPFFGPFIGGIPSGFLILMVSPVKCIWFVIFIVILQQIDGNIIGPKIVGELTNLNSFWVLFAIMLFSGLFGFAGMIVGVPVFAVIYHLVQELIMKGLKRTGYTPPPEEAEESGLDEYLAEKSAMNDSVASSKNESSKFKDMMKKLFPSMFTKHSELNGSNKREIKNK